jgi:hypothetical protein
MHRERFHQCYFEHRKEELRKVDELSFGTLTARNLARRDAAKGFRTMSFQTNTLTIAELCAHMELLKLERLQRLAAPANNAIAEAIAFQSKRVKQLGHRPVSYLHALMTRNPRTETHFLLCLRRLVYGIKLPSKSNTVREREQLQEAVDTFSAWGPVPRALRSLGLASHHDAPLWEKHHFDTGEVVSSYTIGPPRSPRRTASRSSNHCCPSSTPVHKMPFSPLGPAIRTASRNRHVSQKTSCPPWEEWLELHQQEKVALRLRRHPRIQSARVNCRVVLSASSPRSVSPPRSAQPPSAERHDPQNLELRIFRLSPVPRAAREGRK